MLAPNCIAKGEFKCRPFMCWDCGCEWPHQLYVVLGLDPRTSCMLDKHLTNGSTSSAHKRQTLNRRQLWAMDHSSLPAVYVGGKEKNQICGSVMWQVARVQCLSVVKDLKMQILYSSEHKNQSSQMFVSSKCCHVQPPHLNPSILRTR